MKIRTRIYALFFAVFPVAAAASYASWRSVSEFSEANLDARNLARAMLAAERVRGMIYRYAVFSQFTLTEDRWLEEEEQYRAGVLRRLENLARLATRSGEREIVIVLYQDFEALCAQFEAERTRRIAETERASAADDLPTAAASLPPATDAAPPSPALPADADATARSLIEAAREANKGQADVWYSIVAKQPPAFQHLEADLDGLARYYDELLLAVTMRIQDAGYRALLTATLAFVLTVAVLLIVMVQVRVWLLTPLERVGQAAARIGAGDLTHRLKRTPRDEIGDLARRFNDMAAQLQHHQRRLLESREFALMGAMSSSVAHGMRNPLTAIKASAQLMEATLADRPEHLERIRDIIAEVDRMGRRISSLVYFTNPGALKRERTTIGELLELGRAEARATIEQCGMQITVQDGIDRIEVVIDRDQMTQIIAELLRNAALHGRPGTRVSLSAGRERYNGRDDGAVVLVVADDGPGMDAVRLKQAFDLFFTTRPGGSGMGLACARRIVELHGGSMSAESEPGRGTRIVIRLPAAPEQAEQPDQESTRAAERPDRARTSGAGGTPAPMT